MPRANLIRRWLLTLLLALPLLAHAFDFQDVAREAATLARAPYQPAPVADARLAQPSHDDYCDIRFRPERARWRDSGLFPLHFFSLGGSHARPQRLYEVRDSSPRALEVPDSDFQVGSVARGVQPLPGAAGWRLIYPVTPPGQPDDLIVFLGASCFRGLGANPAYGPSARGLAVDTVDGKGEEFPAFTAFWFERAAPQDREMRFYALLDSPRTTGAYRFVVRPGTDTVLEVQARLFQRAPVAMLGIATLTSMFLAGENQPAADDYHPEVHDSDGLLVATDGELIWRPLTNPAQAFVASFETQALRGFGLLQRDRALSSCEDLEAHYQRRPSAWVEPVGDWGPDRVELLQFATPDEAHDNIAACWVPRQLPPIGAPIDLAWRVHWTLGEPVASSLARVLQSRRGHDGFTATPPPGKQQLHVDFAGLSLQALDAAAAVEAAVGANNNVRGLRAHAYPNPECGGCRVNLDFERIDARQPVELRLQLRLAGNLLSETWA